MNHLKIAPQIHLPFDQAAPFGVFMNAYRDLQYLSEFNAANVGPTGGASLVKYLRQLNETRKYYSKPKFLAFQALYWALTAVIIYERYDFYSQKVELITIAPRVLVSRVTAQLIGYNMGLALITKCHLFVTYLFSTRLKPFLPLEFADDIHWQTGILSGVCALIHVVGHGENFKDVSRGMTNMVTCTLGVVAFEGDPTTFWGWHLGTVTLGSGFVLTCGFTVLFTAAQPTLRKFGYDVFLMTHKVCAWSLVLVTFLHGAAALVQTPHYWFFTIFPVMVYACEQVCFRTSHKHTVRLTRVNYDPSTRVISLAGHVLPRYPEDAAGKMLNQAGTWCWIQIPGQPLVKHPFSLSSNFKNPEIFCLNIRVRGPFTRRLVAHYAETCADGIATLDEAKDLIVYGPIGGGMLNWRDADVVVGMAAGVGISPILSIISEAIFVKKVQHFMKREVSLPRGHTHMRAKKCYMAWSLRSRPFAREVVDAVANLALDDLTSSLEILLCVTREGNVGTGTNIHIGAQLENVENDREEEEQNMQELQSAETKTDANGNVVVVTSGTVARMSISERLERIKHRFGAFRTKQMVDYLSDIAIKHPGQSIRVPCCGPPMFLESVMEACRQVRSSTGADIDYALDQAFC